MDCRTSSGRNHFLKVALRLTTIRVIFKASSDEGSTQFGVTSTVLVIHLRRLVDIVVFKDADDVSTKHITTYFSDLDAYSTSNAHL